MAAVPADKQTVTAISLDPQEEVLASTNHVSTYAPTPVTVIKPAGNVPNSAPELEKDPPPQENLMPKKKWNHWAIPAFLVGLTTLYLGFFTTGTIAVLVGAAVTIALAGIALRRGRTHELAGKGFAITALMLGVLATLVTVIAIAVVGFI